LIRFIQKGFAMKRVFTTGQVAKICRVAPRTVSQWFDSGKLQGYRIPGHPDRRIPREALIRFLKENHMPLGVLAEEENAASANRGPEGSNSERLVWEPPLPLGVMNEFTLEQVATLCRVAPQTVAKWFDSGKLQGYRLPGSQERRIPRTALITFLTQNCMPPNGLVAEEQPLPACSDAVEEASDGNEPEEPVCVARDDPAVKDSFTTGQVARICQVQPRTVGKWFESGKLKGFRIRSSGERRIPRDALVRFLQEHGMPLDGLPEEERKGTATD
jgi:excisionase family DNA binding protein